METQENGSAVAQPVLTMQSSATQFLDLATLTLSTQRAHLTDIVGCLNAIRLLL